MVILVFDAWSSIVTKVRSFSSTLKVSLRFLQIFLLKDVYQHSEIVNEDLRFILNRKNKEIE